MKENRKKGFTLAELLVVVAIIGVLVAIAIPTFTAQLKKAKQATDLANARTAYALCQTASLTDALEGIGTPTGTKTYYLQKGGSMGTESSTAYVIQEEKPANTFVGCPNYSKNQVFTITYTAASGDTPSSWKLGSAAKS